MIKFTEEEQSQYDNWSKEQLYEAYILANDAFKEENKRANMAQRELKRVEWEVKQILKSLEN
jgi:hypothetical protein